RDTALRVHTALTPVALWDALAAGIAADCRITVAGRTDGIQAHASDASRIFKAVPVRSATGLPQTAETGTQPVTSVARVISTHLARAVRSARAVAAAGVVVATVSGGLSPAEHLVDAHLDV